MFIGFEDFELCIRGVLSGKPVKAHLIQDIELVHSHRFALKSENKKAVLTRYYADIIGKSYNQITKKHKIIFESSWRHRLPGKLKKC